MYISLKWINELVNIEEIDLNDLIQKLTLGGFEVEEIFEVDINNEKETILDISATANRSDSLSIQGISTEIAALLDQPVKSPKYLIKNDSWNQKIKNEIIYISENPNCSMFLSIIVKNLNNKNIPKWITDKLLSSEITPSNNLLDFQNYVLLETGYPFEFYDFETICSTLKTSDFNLSIKNAKNNEKFVTTTGTTYELDESILTVNANEMPISIGGLIPSSQFSVSESTTSILIEGSIFNSTKIRQQSRNLGLRTERSARYEKSLTNTYLIEALYRLISLLRISNPQLTYHLQSIKQSKEKDFKPIILKYKTIKETLGPSYDPTITNSSYISPKIISNYLKRLNFSFTYDELESIWFVKISKIRSEDIIREIDLIEEIGRLHGFNNFLTLLPKIKQIGSEDSTYKIRKKITSCLLNLGFNELIHYSLVTQTTFLTNQVELINPLLSDCSNLRSSLLPSLIKTTQENLKQKNTIIEGFEYGHVFYKDSKQKFQEKEYISAIFGGLNIKSDWTDAERKLTWFEAKGKIEKLFCQLNLQTCWKKSSNPLYNDLLHPFRKAEVSFPNSLTIGEFGQIHPVLANQLNLPTNIYFFEFSVETIESQFKKNKVSVYKSYSLYPKIIKDLSFIIPNSVSFENLKETVFLNGTQYLIEINLLDIYKGKSIPKNSVSLCLQLVFQSTYKTLENKKIENILTKLQSVLIQNFNANIRN